MSIQLITPSLEIILLPAPLEWFLKSKIGKKIFNLSLGGFAYYDFYSSYEDVGSHNVPLHNVDVQNNALEVGWFIFKGFSAPIIASRIPTLEYFTLDIQFPFAVSFQFSLHLLFAWSLSCPGDYQYSTVAPNLESPYILHDAFVSVHASIAKVVNLFLQSSSNLFDWTSSIFDLVYFEQFQISFNKIWHWLIIMTIAFKQFPGKSQQSDQWVIVGLPLIHFPILFVHDFFVLFSNRIICFFV